MKQYQVQLLHGGTLQDATINADKYKFDNRGDRLNVGFFLNDDCVVEFFVAPSDTIVIFDNGELKDSTTGDDECPPDCAACALERGKQ